MGFSIPFVFLMVRVRGDKRSLLQRANEPSKDAGRVGSNKKDDATQHVESIIHFSKLSWLQKTK